MWNNSDDDPELSRRSIELSSVIQPSDINLTDTSDNKNLEYKPIRKKSERMSAKVARMRSRGNERRENENRVENGEDELFEAPAFTNALRIIKVIALLLIGACALVGMAFSKITFVSITSRMYTLYSGRDFGGNDEKSSIFFQLVFILVIPEIVCLSHCLLWGFIGKTSKSFPWPSWKAMILVSVCIISYNYSKMSYHQEGFLLYCRDFAVCCLVDLTCTKSPTYSLVS